MRQPAHTLLAIAMVASYMLSHSAWAKSSVWKISNGDDYFYLGGTVHLLASEDHPLPEQFMDAYADAKELIFESDLLAMETPAFQQELLAEMMLDSGQTLESQLDAQTYSKLEAFLAERAMPVEVFTHLKPWAVTVVLAVQEYSAMGMVEDYGVDRFISKLGAQDNKTLGLHARS